MLPVVSDVLTAPLSDALPSSVRDLVTARLRARKRDSTLSTTRTTGKENVRRQTMICITRTRHEELEEQARKGESNGKSSRGLLKTRLKSRRSREELCYNRLRAQGRSLLVV